MTTQQSSDVYPNENYPTDFLVMLGALGLAEYSARAVILLADRGRLEVPPALRNCFLNQLRTFAALKPNALREAAASILFTQFGEKVRV
jgi:hypothetical protein